LPSMSSWSMAATYQQFLRNMGHASNSFRWSKRDFGYCSTPPPHRSSQGRIALAFADEAARRRVLSQKLVAFTPHSLASRAAIETRLDLIRERFFEEASDEVRLGINALSAPVFRDAEECVGIIGIVGTS